MKSILSLALVFFALLAGFDALAQSATPVQTVTHKCNRSCYFTDCSIEATYTVPPGGGCVCGCLLGVACCDCEQNSTNNNQAPVNIHLNNVQEFTGWLVGTKDPAYNGLINVMSRFNQARMDAVVYRQLVKDYKEVVNALPSPQKEAVIRKVETH